MPLSPTYLFACQSCGASLPVGRKHLGKKCRCGRCGKISTVTLDDPPQDPPDAPPAYSFACRVCETRLTANVDQVGRQATCPDCGARTPVPPPPKTRAPRIPKAMHGQQYGLWGVDEAPSPAEIARLQPKFFPVFCRVCNTLMHAHPQQVGKQLGCPDCGAKTSVPPPPPVLPKKSALVPDGEEYQLDSAAPLPVRPAQQFAPRPALAMTPQLATPPQPTTPPPVNTAPRPARGRRPLLPTLQGVPAMLLRAPVAHWFLSISMTEIAVVALLILSFQADALVAFLMLIGVSSCLIIATIALLTICLAIFNESSEGNDRLYNLPGADLMDWAIDALRVVFPGILAAIPAVPLGPVLETRLPSQQQLIVAVMVWLCSYPLLLLSTLKNDTPLEPFSYAILASLFSRPAHWLLLFAQSAALVGTTVVATRWVCEPSSWAALLSIPLGIAATLVYFRVLGRFAWWLGKSLPDSALR